MKSFNQLINERKKSVEYKTEQAKLDFILNVCKAMEVENISKTLLAKRMGTSKAYVTKILQGDPINFTIDTMVKICFALGGSLESRINFPQPNKFINKDNRYLINDSWRSLTTDNYSLMAENNDCKQTKIIAVMTIKGTNENKYSNILAS